MTQLERAIGEIQKRQSVRTPILAAVLDMGDAAVDEMLAPLRGRGELVCCDVQVGDKRVVEYRCSAATALNASNKNAQFFQHKTTAGAASAVRTPPAHAPAAPRPAVVPQEASMASKKTVVDRVLDILGEGGEFNLEKLAKRADTTVPTLNTMMGTMIKKHGVKRVGRGIYSLNGSQPPAETPRKKPGKINGSPFAQTIADLQGRKEALLVEVCKIDDAIKAVEAIAA